MTLCPYVCDNKTVGGYCRTTFCINHTHSTLRSTGRSMKMPNFCDTCGHQFSDICGGCETLNGVPVKYEEKPPLGIKPRYIHDHERKLEILDGMERYSNAQKPIPIEWLDELRALILMY